MSVLQAGAKVSRPTLLYSHHGSHAVPVECILWLCRAGLYSVLGQYGMGTLQVVLSHAL